MGMHVCMLLRLCISLSFHSIFIAVLNLSIHPFFIVRSTTSALLSIYLICNPDNKFKSIHIKWCVTNIKVVIVVSDIKVLWVPVNLNCIWLIKTVAFSILASIYLSSIHDNKIVCNSLKSLYELTCESYCGS